jgi:hypothetical protein
MKTITDWADVCIIVARGLDVTGYEMGVGEFLCGHQRFLSFPLTYILTEVFGRWKYKP